MNPEELRTVKPPADVIAELKSFEETAKTPFDTIKAEFYNILVQPYLNQFENVDDRCRQASKILLAQFAEKFSYRTASMEFKVVDMTAIKTFDKEVEKEDPNTHEMVKATEQNQMAKIFGLFAGTGDDDELVTKFGILTLWGDACQLLSSVQADQGYSGEFGITEYDNHYELTLNDPIPLTPATFDLPPIKDMITNFFTPISVSAAEYNLSEDRNDLKLISGRVQSGRISLSKKGKNLGFITLIDDQASIEEIKTQEANKLSIMFVDAPEFATRFITGSQIYALVTLDQSEEYGLSAFGQLVIPIMGIPGNSTPPAPSTPSTPVAQPSAEAAIPPEPSVQQPSIPTQGKPEGNTSVLESTPVAEEPTPQTEPLKTNPADVAGW